MITLLAALALAASSAPPDVVAQFRARDQALMDGVTSGDRALWDRTMSADALYVDEEGNITGKAAILAQITPLPAGNSGKIVISDYKLHLWGGDLATVVHTDDEVEEWHGQTLRANYITTETWQRQAGDWKLVLTHVYVMAKDPPAIALPQAKLAEYEGRYQAGPGVIATIRMDGDHLVFQDRTKPAKPFLVEAQDVLFVPGEKRFKDLFQRDGGGRITGFIQRREGEDVRWTRIS